MLTVSLTNLLNYYLKLISLIFTVFTLSLLNDDFRSSNNIAHNSKILVNNELEFKWKEDIVTLLEII